MPLLSTFGAASARSFGGIGAAAAGAGLDVDEVFSTYLYEGSGTPQTITNNIDLSGEGGMTWIKSRSNGSLDHVIVDTVRGADNSLKPNSTDANAGSGFYSITAFNNNGFTLDSPDGSGGNVNNNGDDFVSWTFRKAPKFFDIVTYTGNGSNRTIAHNLGSDVGMIFIKKTNGSKSWAVFHRQFNSGSSPANYWDQLNNAQAIQSNSDIWNNTAPTSSVFSVGTANAVNDPGGTYVAYLFAHNNSDGEFGPDADQDVIKCGSYTGDGTSDGSNEVTLGFEPQWILTKRSDSTDNWHICDVMREQTTDGSTARLRANTSAAESSNLGAVPTATGFKLYSDNSNGGTFIYMAIRRGPLAEPESATDVFGVNYAYTYDVDGNTGGSSAQLVGYIGKPADLNIQGYRSGSSFNAAVYDRLRNNKYLITNTTSAEASVSGNFWDNMAGFREVASGQDTTMISWTWKRAPGYFDVVAYTGNGTAGRTVSHNLGVAPEMIWVKRRNTTASWPVYHSALGNSKYITLNDTGAASSSGTAFWNSTSPTATEFTVDGNTRANGSGSNYIAYLFATVAGVSKVGSFSHTNGSGDTNVDCGFSSGARFVLYKQYDSSGSWYVLDSVRGIVAGNDPALLLNSTAPEDSSYDQIDPLSSGFTIPSAGVGTGDYIFYAIA